MKNQSVVTSKMKRKCGKSNNNINHFKIATKVLKKGFKLTKKKSIKDRFSSKGSRKD